MPNITRETIIKICSTKKTIPLEKFGINNHEGRVEPKKTPEQIAVYLQESRFDLMNPNFNKEMIDYICSVYSGEKIFDYELQDGEEIYSCDVYLPELKLAFKALTFFKYCEINVDKKYQLKTHNIFAKSDIKIIQIFQDTWALKNEIICSRIKNLLGYSKTIYARKCIVKELNSEKDTTIVGKFCDQNHTQGKVGASVKLGLFYNDELVSVMTFGGGRANMGRSVKVGEYELLRFCNKLGTGVIGGSSKLFSYFVKHYNPDTIYSFADLTWSSSTDNLYKSLGLDYVSNSEPSYFYICGDKKKGRYLYRKSELLDCGYDDKYVSETGLMWQEHNMCIANNMYRIFDVGTVKFQWTKK